MKKLQPPKKIFQSLPIILLLIFTHGFSQAAPAPPKAKWTIMVYMAAYNGFEEEAIADIEEMKATSLDNNINITIFVDWPAQKGIPGQKIVLRKGSTPISANTSEYNTGVAQTLTDFIDKNMQDFPADNYGLIIWSHGHTWSYENFSPIDGLQTQFKPIAADESDNDILSLREVSEALEKKTDHGKLTFIGFDVNVMSSLEVWTQLKKQAIYGIASEDIVPIKGWNYQDIFSKLTQATDGISFCKVIVQSTETSYNSLSPDNTYYTQAAIDLSKIDGLNNQIKQLLPILKKQPASTITMARETIYSPYGYDRKSNWPNYIDLKKLLLSYKVNSTDPATKTQIGKFINVYDQAVIAHVSDAYNIKSNGSWGIAIYFPETNAIYESDPEGKDFPAIALKEWVDFLDYYFNNNSVKGKKQKDRQSKNTQLKGAKSKNR